MLGSERRDPARPLWAAENLFFILESQKISISTVGSPAQARTKSLETASETPVDVDGEATPMAQDGVGRTDFARQR